VSDSIDWTAWTAVAEDLSVLHVDCPLRIHEFRQPPETRPTISPLDRRRELRSNGAEFVGFGVDANSAEVEPVCVPASLDRNVGVGQAIGVACTGFVSQLELFVGKGEELASENCPQSLFRKYLSGRK
jgi:hypothetical protein